MQKIEVPIVRTFVTIHDDPMAYFLSKYVPENRCSLSSHMNAFLVWLNKRRGWGGVGPKQLLIRQLQSKNPYEIPDLLQEFVTTRPNLRETTLYDIIRVVLGFLQKNHCQLPPDVKPNWFKVRSAVPPIQSRLTAEIIRNVVVRLPLRWRSLYLVKYQSMLDTKRLCWVNRNSADQITSQLREGKNIIRVDLPCGRKKYAGDSQGIYFSYFGRDAASDLTRYFDDERGWPKLGQPIWVYSREDYKKRGCSKNMKIGDPIEWKSIVNKWSYAVYAANYVHKEPDSEEGHGARYGLNLHEFRDVATTELHTHAKSEGLDMDCVMFWSGLVGQLDFNLSHLRRDRLYKNPDYMETQYAIAEPHLNIISGTPADKKVRNSAQNIWSYGVTYSAPSTTTMI